MPWKMKKLKQRLYRFRTVDAVNEKGEKKRKEGIRQREE